MRMPLGDRAGDFEQSSSIRMNVDVCRGREQRIEEELARFAEPARELREKAAAPERLGDLCPVVQDERALRILSGRRIARLEVVSDRSELDDETAETREVVVSRRRVAERLQLGGEDAELECEALQAASSGIRASS